MLPVVTKQKKTHVIVPISRTFLKGYMAAGKERKLVLCACFTTVCPFVLVYALSFICSWVWIIHLFMGLGVVIEPKALNQGKKSTVVHPSPLNDLQMPPTKLHEDKNLGNKAYGCLV